MAIALLFVIGSSLPINFFTRLVVVQKRNKMVKALEIPER